MNTQSLESQNSPDPHAGIREHLCSGQIGLFPTDTVYGLGCRADSADGTRRIFDIKGRDFAKTLPILIGDWAQFEALVEPQSESITRRLREVWPGGLTAVVRASAAGRRLSPDCLREGTLAVRMPAHAELCRLIVETGCPLAATSANLSGEKEHLRLVDIAGSIRAAVDWEWDEDILQDVILPSTVVDLLGEKPVILRQGGVDF